MATVPIATYLLKRIHQLGVTHVQGTISRLHLWGKVLTGWVGVPGDMNLHFLDYLEDIPEITWGKELSCLSGLTSSWQRK